MKTKSIILLSFSLLLSKLHAGIIHTDPYDIKKTNVTLGGIYSNPRGAALFLSVNHAVSNKLNVMYTGFYFPQLFMDDKYYDAEQSFAYKNGGKNKFYMYNSLGVDFNFADKKKNKRVSVVLESRSSTIGNKTTNNVKYTLVNSYKRKIWALYGGVMSISGRDMFYKESNVDEYLLYNTASGSNVDIKNPSGGAFGRSVFSNTFIGNLEIGIKHKGILATCYNHPDYGKKWNDSYFEWYLTALLPAVSSYDKNVYKNNSSTAFQIVQVDKPKPGFKLGFNMRTSVKTNYMLGGEFGYLPSIQKGNVLYFAVKLGISLNFGKIHYEEDKEDTSDAPADESE